VPLSPSSITWYRRKLGSKQTCRAIHWPRIRGLAVQAGVWLRAIIGNGDHHWPMGPCGLGRTLLFTWHAESEFLFNIILLAISDYMGLWGWCL